MRLWLINWVVKKNHSVGWTALEVTWSVYDSTGWYLFSVSWYCLVLGGTRIGSAKGLYACIYWKKWRFGRVTLMPHSLTHTQTTEYSATQQIFIHYYHIIFSTWMFWWGFYIIHSYYLLIFFICHFIGSAHVLEYISSILLVFFLGHPLYMYFRQ